MKNTRYFPFERNRYFYGKLLSVDDFELEQRYVNNKRRMANRFLQGIGVAAGLHVVRIDEKTISVESGFALDALGREIVVDTPSVRKLSLLDGYSSSVAGRDKEYVYLCLAYEETPSGMIYNIAGNAAVSGEEQEYNKIKETYRLYLTDQEPGQEGLNKDALYEQPYVLYMQGGIKIRLVAPRYLAAGDTGELRLEVTNTGKKYLSFSFEAVLDCLSYEGKPVFTVHFNEGQYEKTGKYVLSYPVTAAGFAQAPASVQVREKKVQLFLDKEPLEYTGRSLSFPVQIVRGDIRSRVIEEYYHMAMENIEKQNREDRLYLARIYLLWTYDTGDDACVIDYVEPMPFRQYLLNQNLSFALHQLAIDRADAWRSHEPAAAQDSSDKGRKERGVRVSQGSCWLDLNGGGQRGDRFISEEIPHGLGIGPVFVQVGLEDQDGAVTYGSCEIFSDMELMLELAVRIFAERGTFQIGGRLREQVIKSGVSVHWTAIRRIEEKPAKELSRKIFIKPSVVELAARESCYLEAACTNMEDTEIEWKVQEHGGSMSQNGMYTAPNLPGVYEVTAQSVAYPEVRASVFVVVREGESDVDRNL